MAWRWRWKAETLGYGKAGPWNYSADGECSDPSLKDIEPLYSASDFSALQGEVERLRKVLTKIATQKGISAVGIARQALGEQQ